MQVSDIIQERSVTNSQNTWAESIYLFTKVGPFEGDHAHINRVGDKSFVVHQLIWSEGWDCVEEQLCRLFEVPDGHTVQALVHFQTVPPVPVAPLLNEAAGTVWHEHVLKSAIEIFQIRESGAFTSLLSLCCVWWGHYPCRKGRSSAGRRRYPVCDPEPRFCHRSSWRLLGRPPVDTRTHQACHEHFSEALSHFTANSLRIF